MHTWHRFCKSNRQNIRRTCFNWTIITFLQFSKRSKGWLQSQQGENTLVFVLGHEPSCGPGMCLNVHVFLHVFFWDSSRTFQIECAKKCSEFIWRANLQICFLFSKMWRSDTFLSVAWKNLITYPFLHLSLSLVSMHNLSLCCLVSLRFNLDFFPLGHLDKNAKTFLDIVKYHLFSAHTCFPACFAFRWKWCFNTISGSLVWQSHFMTAKSFMCSVSTLL